MLWFVHPTRILLAVVILSSVTMAIVGLSAFIAIAATVAVALFIALHLSDGKKDIADELKCSWSAVNERDRDFEALESQYLVLTGDSAGSGALDAPTWMDLDMDSVFSCMDRTHTNAGELMLYRMLHRILNEPDELEARNRAVRCMMDDESARMNIRTALHNIGRDAKVDLTAMLWTNDIPDLGHTRLYNLLAASALASAVAAVFVGPAVLLFCTLPLFVINTLLSTVILRDRIIESLRTLRYLGQVIGMAEKLASIDCEPVHAWQKGIRSALPAASGILKGIRLLNPEGSATAEFFQQIMYFILTLFLVEVRAFNRVVAEVRRNRAELQDLVRLIGELDAIQSVASFRSSLECCCEPEFLGGPPKLDILDGWHPLTSTPVPNSLHCNDECFFITGSNMAGKSTFLRMIAVNVVLAQTFHFCCARRYAATPFRLASSIAHLDDITGSTSYFLAEGKRLLHLLRNAEQDKTPYLCIVDEMLRGTNSVERHAASLAVLRRLAETGAIVIVASHDTDLGCMLKERYEVFHFSESFEDDNLAFDYKLKPGICASGNAIRTLEWLGFPSPVIQEARRYLARISETGPNCDTDGTEQK